MAENFYSILTAVGLAKIANAQVSGNKVDLTQIAVGDGGGTYYNPTQNDTHLKNEVWRGNIGSVEIDPENPNWIVIESYIPSTVGGFTVREVGIFDAEGDMIAIGKYPETFKPSLEEGASKDLLLRMIIEVTNASAVTLKIDPGVIIASRKYVDEKVGVVSNNLMQLQQDFMSHSAEVASKTKYGHVKIGNGIDVSNGIISVSDMTASNVSIADVANNFESTTVEGALSELFTNVSDGKSLIGGAITDVDPDVIVPAEPTFQDLATAIGSINTGKKWASGVLTQQTTEQIHVVDGLDFKPSVVVGFSHQEDFSNDSRSTIWFFYVNRSDYAGVSGNVQQSSFGWTNSTDIITINNNGFIINEKGGISNIISLPMQFTWVAFE